MTLQEKPVLRQEQFLKYYGSKISSELLLPKSLRYWGTVTGYLSSSGPVCGWSDRLDDKQHNRNQDEKQKHCRGCCIVAGGRRISFR